MAGDVTGRWSGYYSQRDEAARIEAELIQNGDDLSGLMRDAVTDREQTVFEFAAAAGLPPGADEAIAADLLGQFPDARGEPIRYVVRLPKESDLAGTVRGRDVTFTKVYRGSQASGFQVGRHFHGVVRPGHSVRYEGRLSRDGRRIEGKWVIETPTEQGVRRQTGDFVLERPGG